MLLCGDGAGSVILRFLRRLLLRLLIRLLIRLSGVWFAALLAVTVRSNYSDASTVATKFSAGKINSIFIVICWCPL
jgi:hypothetical protein